MYFLSVQRLGESCAEDEVCIGPFTQCSGGICSCNKGYILSSDGLWCTHKTSWFINFPLIGDGCSTFFSECFHSLEQSCEDGKCQCMTGLRKVEDDDLLVPSSTYYQCRNASLGIGRYNFCVFSVYPKIVGVLIAVWIMSFDLPSG